MVYIYIASVVVFFGISFYISYLIGKYSNFKQYKALNKEIEVLRETNISNDKKYQELETQILEQSKYYSEQLKDSEALRKRIEEAELKKNNLKTDLEALSEEIKQNFSQKNEFDRLKLLCEDLDIESLEWKNKYTNLHRQSADELIILKDELTRQKRYIKQLLAQKYRLIHQWDAKKVKQIIQVPLKQSSAEQDDTISNLELKLKRQENIIKALRIQLKHLNLKKIESTGIEETPENLLDHESGFEVEDDLDTLDNIIEENDFHEILDEENIEAQKLMDKLKEFKEIKIRKTGETTLNYSKVNQMWNQEDKSESEEEISSNITDNSDKPNKKSQKKRHRNSRLSLIFNIDRTIQSKLYALGIRSFEQLAGIDDDFIQELESLLGIESGRIRNEKWVEQAHKLNSSDDIRSIFIQTRQSNKTTSEISTDDLLQIKGIGKTYKHRLVKIGIKNIQDLASWDKENIEELAELIEVNKSRIVGQKWIDQAKNLISTKSVN